MTARDLHLGIDLGTSSVKAVIVNGAGLQVARSGRPHPVQTPAPGHAEADPDDWWQGVVAAVNEAVEAVDGTVVSIGVSGQMHGLVLVDDHAGALRPAMLWPDQRAVRQLDAWFELSAPRRARLGNPFVPGMTGPMLAWLSDHEPAVLDRATAALLPKDWVRSRLVTDLVAEMGTDASDASATLLWDLPADNWALDVAATVGIDPRLLPPVTESSVVVGTVAGRVAADLGLPADTPVVAGAADTAAALVGSGTTDVGSVQMTLGTGGQVATPLDAPRTHPERGVHTYRAAMPQRWYAMGATLNVGLCLEWVRRILGMTWPELYDTATVALMPDDPVFLPHLVGERTPHLDTDLRGAWVGLSRDHNRDVLARSALEGVAFSLHDALAALGGSVSDDVVSVAGGGARSDAWLGLLADVLDCPLAAVDIPDASGRGAALLGALGIGAVPTEDIGGRLRPTRSAARGPRPDRVVVHAARRARFATLVPAVRSAWASTA